MTLVKWVECLVEVGTWVLDFWGSVPVFTIATDVLFKWRRLEQSV